MAAHKSKSELLKQSLAFVGLGSFLIACSGRVSYSGSGAQSSGSSSAGGDATAGPATGGAGGRASGGAGSSGAHGGVSGMSAGTGGSVGRGGMTGTGASFKCPPGPFEAPLLAGAIAMKVPGTPPEDDFNSGQWTNVEGPVWIGDSLFFSELTGADLPPARILQLATGDMVSVAVPTRAATGSRSTRKATS